MIHKLLKRRARTLDRDASQTPIHTVEQIGPKRAKTPEGFLCCYDVPISRVGTMVYGPQETPIKPGPDQLCYVERSAGELFAPETIASFNGKSIVDNHPEDDVLPENWNALTIGVVLNPRQGTGDDHDVLLADLLVTQKAAIADVLAGKREVSAGYGADYRQTGPGRGVQTAIIGNHVALVEKGRCGPRCAIGDHSSTEEHEMPITKREVTIPRRPVTNAVRAAVRKVFRDAEEVALGALNDEDEIDEAPEAGGKSSSGGDTHIHIHSGGQMDERAAGTGGAEDPALEEEPGEELADPNKVADDDPVEARFQALEAGHTKILEQLQGLAGAIQKLGGGATQAADAEEADPAEAEEEKEAAKVGDSAALSTGFQALAADAEVLVPGYRVPTFDAKAARKATVDTMCATRRRVLDHVYNTVEGKATLDGLAAEAVGTLDLAKQTCGEVALLFKAAAAAKRTANNGEMTRDAHRMVDPNAVVKKSTVPTTPAEYNEFYKKYYAPKV